MGATRPVFGVSDLTPRQGCSNLPRPSHHLPGTTSRIRGHRPPVPVARRGASVTACRCQFCNDPLEPAQELRYLVELQNLDDPTYLARIRRLPAVNGRPLRVCQPCQTHVETTPRPAPPVVPVAVAAGLLAACGLLSVGLLFFAMVGPPRV